mmetsp:Transcript_27002/g.65608  ORF Transcript_27002/g.65608 Transcript_27002/m.65608 type:complete len:145 (+) Transcript_27002:814-1248(+)
MQETGGDYTVQEVKELGGRKMNFVRIEVRANFIQSFTPDNFPFDIQQLRVPLCLSFQTCDKRHFAPLNPDADMVYVLSEFSAIEEWNIVSAEAAVYADTSNYPWCTATIVLQRKPWNVVRGGPMAYFLNFFCIPKAAEGSAESE